MPDDGLSPWRLATLADLDTILAIQAEVHPLMQERAEVLADKLDLFPEGCRMLMHGGASVAYAMAHPYRLDAVPPLDAVMGGLPEAPDCLFIHDVAVLPPARRHGAGRTYVGEMKRLAAARGLQALALVSVYGTYPIWEKAGFVIKPLEGLADKFGPFGATARYMTAPIL